MRGKRFDAVEDRLETLERVVDKVDRSVERIEIVTVVREPNSTVAADAYNGLRKQVIAAVGERNAHLHQLVQFDSALRAGGTVEDLGALVREWLSQASVQVVDDPGLEDAFEVVGPDGGPDRRVVKPAYVDGLTGRVVREGLVERVAKVEPARDGQPAGVSAAVEGRQGADDAAEERP
jgi:hypothetical protein